MPSVKPLLMLLAFALLAVVLFGLTIMLAPMQGARLRINGYTLKQLAKSISGSKLENHTSHALQVLDFNRKVSLKPNQQTQQAGLPDVDGFILARPTLIQGRVYPAGHVLRVCDWSHLIVRAQISHPAQDEVVWQWPPGVLLNRISCWAVEPSLADVFIY